MKKNRAELERYLAEIEVKIRRCTGPDSDKEYKRLADLYDEVEKELEELGNE